MRSERNEVGIMPTGIEKLISEIATMMVFFYYICK